MKELCLSADLCLYPVCTADAVCIQDVYVLCVYCRSVPVHSAVCSQSAVWREDSARGGHGSAAGSEDEEGLDSLGTPADRHLWCRYPSIALVCISLLECVANHEMQLRRQCQ